MPCRPFRRPATSSFTRSEKRSELSFDSYALFRFWDSSLAPHTAGR